MSQPASAKAELLLANQNTAVAAHFEGYQPFCCPLSEIMPNLLCAGLMSPFSGRVSLPASAFSPLRLILCGSGRAADLVQTYAGKKQSSVNVVWFCLTGGPWLCKGPGKHKVFGKSVSCILECSPCCGNQPSGVA